LRACQRPGGGGARQTVGGGGTASMPGWSSGSLAGAWDPFLPAPDSRRNASRSSTSVLEGNKARVSLSSSSRLWPPVQAPAGGSGCALCAALAAAGVPRATRAAAGLRGGGQRSLGRGRPGTPHPPAAAKPAPLRSVSIGTSSGGGGGGWLSTAGARLGTLAGVGGPPAGSCASPPPCRRPQACARPPPGRRAAPRGR
jgi:hypothetical protein